MRNASILAGLTLFGMTAALGGSASARPLKPAQEALIKPVGKPVSCVQLNHIRETRVRDDKTIDFYMQGQKVYRNRLPHSCPQLGFEEKFSYKTSLSQLCSTDIITVLTSPGLSTAASCGLGEFQPVTGAPR
jgi:hypothetical protein